MAGTNPNTLWVHPPYSLISEVCAKLRDQPIPDDLDDPNRYHFDIVYFRDYSKFPVVRYWVRWQGYEANATESHSWAYETPDTLSMWIALERGYGIFPEKGITKRLLSRIRRHKMESYQHVFPICQNTPTVSSTVRSRTLSRRSTPLPSNLVGQVIEHLLDRPALDSDHAVFLAGLILSGARHER